MLPDRRQIVLKVLIEEYISRALPVGSRTLVERYNLGISSATVRNELSRLEEEGYLTQPHTSSGRIPTDSGYRAFVDDLLANEDFSGQDELIQALRQSAGELDDLIEKTSEALIRLTDCMTLLVPPRALSVDIRVINLISLSACKTLMVIVTKDGQVFNRSVDTLDELSEEDIKQVEQKLNTYFMGSELSTYGDAPLLPEDDAHNALLQTFIGELYICLQEQGKTKPHPFGMTRLLGQPEFSESANILPVLEKLEDDTMLLQIFHDALNSDLPYIRIGHENDSEALSGVSLVASQFGDGPKRGLIAIIGPTRMNYSQVFKAVRAAKNVLSER